ncbi:MAG TPA: tetratricopeptide repeat protein [Longimicrobiales bacterium]|nr:tetratricopeptide repeat protein [Longimicrobiales bacterium]
MKTDESAIGGRWRRVRDRKVAQWALAYAAGAWLLLQISDIVGGHFGWPALVGQALTVALAGGLALVLVVAWYHGEKERQRVSAVELLMLTGIFIIAGTALAAVGRKTDVAQIERDEVATYENSIAVLPFADLSEDSDQAYFAEGVSEEILNRLAQIRDLRVAARTSSFSFKDKNTTVSEVGRTLRVGHVLEGSVRRQGTMVRVAAQLIKTEDGFHVWSNSYDGDVSDIFAVQDEIASAIIEALEPQLGAAPGGRDVRPAISRVTVAGGGEAHEMYLRGLGHWHRRGVALDTALVLFEAAVRADSTYPEAWAGLANTYAVLPLYRTPSWQDVRMKAFGAAYRALSLNPSLSEAYAALGQIFRNERQLHAAETALRRAIEMSPSNADAYEDLALVLLTRGEHGAAAQAAQRAVNLSPLYPR